MGNCRSSVGFGLYDDDKKCYPFLALHDTWSSTHLTLLSSEVSPDFPSNLEALVHGLELASYPRHLGLGSFGFQLSPSGDEPFRINQRGLGVLGPVTISTLEPGNGHSFCFKC